MAAYEIAVSLQVKDYFYSEKKAVSSVSAGFDTFSAALTAYCEAVSFGYTVNTDALRKHLAAYRKKPEDVEQVCRLMLIRHENGLDTVILENLRSDSGYEENDSVISCNALNREELAVLSAHGVEPEEDSLGSYFEVYPLNDLLYDLSDACDGKLDPMREDLKALVEEYAHAHALMVNEIDPGEDGYFCPGSSSPDECFNSWGNIYGYANDERDIFINSLVRYAHGFVLEFRE